jgi:hypothetical protein
LFENITFLSSEQLSHVSWQLVRHSTGLMSLMGRRVERKIQGILARASVSWLAVIRHVEGRHLSLLPGLVLNLSRVKWVRARFKDRGIVQVRHELKSRGTSGHEWGTVPFFRGTNYIWLGSLIWTRLTLERAFILSTATVLMQGSKSIKIEGGTASCIWRFFSSVNLATTEGVGKDILSVRGVAWVERGV